MQIGAASTIRLSLWPRLSMCQHGARSGRYVRLVAPRAKGNGMSARYWTYLPSEAGKLDVDRAFYPRVSEAVASAKLVDSFEIPIRSGKAWSVRAGQVCRVITKYG